MSSIVEAFYIYYKSNDPNKDKSNKCVNSECNARREASRIFCHKCLQTMFAENSVRLSWHLDDAKDLEDFKLKVMLAKMEG